MEALLAVHRDIDVEPAAQEDHLGEVPVAGVVLDEEDPIVAVAVQHLNSCQR